MTLLGRAVVAIWNGIRPEAREDFNEWHSREHMPERVGIPGFLRGRRYMAEQGWPEWFTLYEVEHPETLGGADYLTRLNDPTAWTRRVVPSFTDVTRSLCRVSVTVGPGVGGYIATLRCNAAPGRAKDLARWLEAFLREAADRPGVHGAHLCLLEPEASSIQTEERRTRGTANLLAEVIALVEASGRDQLAGVLHQLSRDQLIGAGAAGDAPIEAGLYRLEFLC